MNGPDTRRTPAKGGPRSESLSQANDTQSLPAASDGIEDPQQAPLFPVARARNHIARNGSLVRDPETSFAAIPDPVSITRGQRVVLSAVTIEGRGGRLLTLEDIVKAVRKSFPQLNMSASGVRSRVAECVRRGSLVVVDEHGTTSHGRRCRRFKRAE